MLTQSTINKIAKNVAFLETIRPVQTSSYRQTADAIIQQYKNRYMSNLKTALNFVLKLSNGTYLLKRCAHTHTHAIGQGNDISDTGRRTRVTITRAQG